MKKSVLKLIVAALLLSVIVSFAVACTGAEMSSSESVDAYNNCVEQDPNGKYVLIAFPGLGIGAYIVPQIAFTVPLGGSNKLTVYWSNLLIMAAVALAFAYIVPVARKRGIKPSDILDISLWSIVGGMLGARLYYVACVPSSLNGSILNFFNVGDGMAFYGALLGGMLAAFIVCKVKKLNFAKTIDPFVPGIMMAQCIGRWADFIAGASYGYELREGSLLYWLRMAVYPHLGSDSGIAAGKGSLAYVHPTFLYESLWMLVGFIAVNLIFLRLQRKPDGKRTLGFSGRFEGQLLYLYMIWYGAGRTVTEMLRTDSLCIPGTTIRLSVLVSCIIMLAGIALIVHGLIMTKKAALAAQSYDASFPLFHKDDAKSATDDSKEVDNREDN